MKKYSLVIIGSIIFFSHSALATFGSNSCKKSPDIKCYVTKRGDTWEKLFKDPDTIHFAKLLNRMGNQLHRGMTIAMPKTLSNADVMSISPFPKQISAPGEKMIMVSLPRLAWGAYDSQGTLLRWGPVSGGKGYCPDLHSRCNTPVGKFVIQSKQGPYCVSTKFPIGRGGAPMPYCMFFKGGFALHGSYDVPGYNASHGCVRMMVNDAQWLNQEFVGYDKVTVIISRN